MTNKPLVSSKGEDSTRDNKEGDDTHQDVGPKHHYSLYRPQSKKGKD